jgi:hypothetical protein
MTQLDRIAKEWLAARNVIATALGEWYGGSPQMTESRATAIIARLASHDPPILLSMDDGEPDQDGPVCHVCGERSPDCIDRDGVPACPQCADQDYTGPVCSHCREPVNSHNGTITSGLRQTWLCDSCAAAAEREWDRKREERE